MDQNIRASIQTSTFYYFLIISILTTISQLTTMMTIIFGDIAGKEMMVAATVIASGFFGAFGTIRIMTNLHLIMHEMDDKTAATNWGSEMKSLPLKVLRFVFAGIFLLVAVVQLITIYS